MPEYDPTLAWTRAPRPPRRQGPGIEEIVTAAIAIADTEGLESVSMRRVARDLGSGTATLYRCLTGRDELIDLMIDHVHGECDLPGPTGDWRADLTVLAHHLRTTLLRHAWLGPQIAGRPALGPHSLRNQEFALAAATEFTPDIARATRIVDAVGAYIFGATTRQLAEQRAHRHSGLGEDQWRRAVAPYLLQVLSGGEHPHLSRRIHEDTDATFEDSFAFGLTALLDGIAHTARHRLP